MRVLFKVLKTAALLIAIFMLALMVIQGVLLELVGNLSLGVELPQIFTNQSTFKSFSILTASLYLVFYFFQKWFEKNIPWLKILGKTLLRAALIGFLVWAFGEVLRFLIKASKDKTAAEQEDALWILFAPILILFTVLIVGCVLSALKVGDRTLRGSTTCTGSSLSTSAEKTLEIEACSAGKQIDKHYSKNAWREFMHHRYVLVNCFHDHYGQLHTVDEGTFDRALKEFSDQNYAKYYTGMNTSDKIYGADGDSGYRGMDKWLIDGRGETFIILRK